MCGPKQDWCQVTYPATHYSPCPPGAPRPTHTRALPLIKAPLFAQQISGARPLFRRLPPARSTKRKADSSLSPLHFYLKKKRHKFKPQVKIKHTLTPCQRPPPNQPNRKQMDSSGLTMIESSGQYLYVWLSLSVVCIPYMVFVCPDLYVKVSPVLPIIISLLFFSTLLFLFLTSVTEPGIIPRKLIFDYQKRIPAQFTNDATLEPEPDNQNSSLRSSQRVFCDTCKIWRPERTSHCGECNNCVEVTAIHLRQDLPHHYLPWETTCRQIWSGR